MKKINILVLLVAGVAMMNVQGTAAAAAAKAAATAAAAKAAGTTAAKPGTTAAAAPAAPAKGNWNPVQGVTNFFGGFFNRKPAAPATAPK